VQKSVYLIKMNWQKEIEHYKSNMNKLSMTNHSVSQHLLWMM